MQGPLCTHISSSRADYNNRRKMKPCFSLHFPNLALIFLMLLSTHATQPSISCFSAIWLNGSIYIIPKQVFIVACWTEFLMHWFWFSAFINPSLTEFSKYRLLWGRCSVYSRSVLIIHITLLMSELQLLYSKRTICATDVVITTERPAKFAKIQLLKYSLQFPLFGLRGRAG